MPVVVVVCVTGSDRRFSVASATGSRVSERHSICSMGSGGGMSAGSAMLSAGSVMLGAAYGALGKPTNWIIYSAWSGIGLQSSMNID